MLCTSCVTYQQPLNLAPDQQAVISPSENRRGSAVIIDKVDGLPTSSRLSPFPFRGPVIVRPGKHVLRVRVLLVMAEGLVDLWLRAEPGRTYRIEREVHDRQFRVWLVDENTGAIVGGLEGGADEPEN